MRIVHLITRLVHGGAQINTILTAAHQRRQGHDVVLAAGPETGPEGTSWEMARQLGVEPVLLPDLVRDPALGHDLRALRQIHRLLRKHRPDVLHTHTSKAGALGRLVAWWVGIHNVIHTPHGHVFHGYFSSWKTRAYIQAERLLARATRTMVALTPAERDEHLAQRIGRVDQFVVIPSGVDIRSFQRPRDLSVRHSLGMPTDRPLIGCVARLSPIKGVLDAVCAMSHVPDAHLVVGGDGPQRADIEAEIRTRQLEGRVRLLGHVDDVPTLLQALDLFVVPSHNEGMGRTAVEAMAAGLPVVATRIGGLIDVVEDGVTGVLVTPKDPQAIAAGIRQVLSSANAAAMGEAARARAQNYSLETMLQQLDALYAS